MNKERTGRIRTPSKRVWSFAILLFVLSSVFSGYVMYLDRKVVSAMEGSRWNIPSEIYSSPTVVEKGMSEISLKKMLKSRGYISKSGDHIRPGEYRTEKGSYEIFLQGSNTKEQGIDSFQVRILIVNGKIEGFLRIPSMKRIRNVSFEPSIIAGIFDAKREEREIAMIDEMPEHLLHAVVTVEDARFYSHFGIDFRAMMRAMWTNIRSGEIRQGGSTITQQLVKNFFLTGKKSLIRKAREALMAIIVEIHYSKNDIMEAYLNEIYLGADKGINICGVKEAADFYFSKPLGDLSLSESALMTALIRSPGMYNPFLNPDRAIRRRNLVLDLMQREGIIDKDEAEKARGNTLGVKKRERYKNPAPYFTDFLREQIRTAYSEDVLTSKGLQIFTTLDADLQHIANRVISEGLSDLEKRLGLPHSKKLQAALIAIEPRTGFIRAMVGGRDYRESYFNRATMARRQPASLFKPIVYLTAMEKLRYTPSTMVMNTTKTWEGANEKWIPRNPSKISSPMVTVQTALENSLNLPSIHTAEKIGVKNIAAMARKLGISSDLREDLSLAIGGSEVTPLEMASVYQVIAAGGMAATPSAVIDIISKDGSLIEHNPVKYKNIIPSSHAAVMTRMLNGTVDRGTASVLKGKLHVDIAAKTGTSNAGRDAWFVGYTADLLTLVWVGYDDNAPLNLTGASAALPLWISFMTKAMEDRTFYELPLPDDVVEVTVDLTNGMKARSGCTVKADLLYVEGTEPVAFCTEHSSSVIEWFKNLFKNWKGTH